MTKTTNKVITVLSIILIIAMLGMSVFADSIKPGDLEDGTIAGKDTIQNSGKNIIATIQGVGMVVAVVILLVLGIKYLMGSAEEKAEYKKTMIPYLVGAILLFAATGVIGLVQSFAEGIF